MDFLKKVKRYVLGEDAMEAQPRQQPGASPSSARPDVAERARRPAAAAAARRQQAPPPAQEPVLQSAGYGASGGIQGLNWYRERLREDRDGDTADEFLVEPSVAPAQPAAPAAAQRASACAGAADVAAAPAQTSASALKVQRRNLKAARRGDVVVLEGNVHIVPPA